MLTLSKIAKEIGVCKTTVSLVLNGKAEQSRISAETVRRVREYCSRANYLPNIHARRMCREVVGNFLVLLNIRDGVRQASSFSEYNVSQILSGVAETAEAVGFTFGIRLFGPQLDEESIFNSFRSREFDGMIYYGMSIPEPWLAVFEREQRRIIGIGIEAAGNVLSVNIDNRAVAREQGEYLLRRGYGKFLYLGGVASSYPGNERYAGFREAVAGKAEVEMVRADFSEERAEAVVTERLAGGLKPDAIVCANDKMALGSMAALKKLKIRVPDGIAVAGGDNIEIGRYVEPGLTTFDNRAFDLGAAACRMLLDTIGGGKPDNVVLESRLVTRESA